MPPRFANTLQVASNMLELSENQIETEIKSGRLIEVTDNGQGANGGEP